MEVSRVLQSCLFMMFASHYALVEQTKILVWHGQEYPTSTLCVYLYVLGILCLVVDGNISLIVSVVTLLTTVLNSETTNEVFQIKSHHVVVCSNITVNYTDCKSGNILSYVDVNSGLYMLQYFATCGFVFLVGGISGAVAHWSWTKRVPALMWLLRHVRSECQVTTVTHQMCETQKVVENQTQCGLFAGLCLIVYMCRNGLMKINSKSFMLLLLLICLPSASAQPEVVTEWSLFNMLPLGNGMAILIGSITSYTTSIVALGALCLMDWAVGLTLACMFLHYTAIKMRAPHFFVGALLIIMAKATSGDGSSLLIIVVMQIINWLAMFAGLSVGLPSLLWSSALFNFIPVAKYLTYQKPLGGWVGWIWDVEVPAYIAFFSVFAVLALETIPSVTYPIIVQKRNIMTGKVISTTFEAGVLTKLLVGDYIPTWDVMISQCSKIGEFVAASGPRSIGIMPMAKRLLYWNRHVSSNGDSELVSDHRAIGIVRHNDNQRGVCFVTDVNNERVIIAPIHVVCGEDGKPLDNLSFDFPGMKIVVENATCTLTAPGTDMAVYSTSDNLPCHLMTTLQPSKDMAIYAGYDKFGRPFNKIVKRPVGGITLGLIVEGGESGSVLINPDTGKVFGQLWCKMDKTAAVFVGMNPASLMTKRDLCAEDADYILKATQTSKDALEARLDLKCKINTLTNQLLAARHLVMQQSKTRLKEVLKANEKIKEIEAAISKAEDAIPEDLVYEHKLYTQLLQAVISEMGDKQKEVRFWRSEKQKALAARNELAATDTSTVSAIRAQLKSLGQDLQAVEAEIKAGSGQLDLEGAESTVDGEPIQQRMPDTKPKILFPIIANMGTYYRIWWDENETEDVTGYPAVQPEIVEKVKILFACNAKTAKKLLIAHTRSKAWAMDKMKVVESTPEPMPQCVQTSFQGVVQWFYDNLSITQGPRSTCTLCGKRFECTSVHVHTDICARSVAGDAERHGVWCSNNFCDGSSITIEGTQYILKEGRIGLSRNFMCTRQALGDKPHTCFEKTPKKYNEVSVVHSKEGDLYITNRCMEELIKKLHNQDIAAIENSAQYNMLIARQNQQKIAQTCNCHDDILELKNDIKMLKFAIVQPKIITEYTGGNQQELLYQTALADEMTDKVSVYECIVEKLQTEMDQIIHDAEEGANAKIALVDSEATIKRLKEEICSKSVVLDELKDSMRMKESEIREDCRREVIVMSQQHASNIQEIIDSNMHDKKHLESALEEVVIAKTELADEVRVLTQTAGELKATLKLTEHRLSDNQQIIASLQSENEQQQQEIKNLKSDMAHINAKQVEKEMKIRDHRFETAEEVTRLRGVVSDLEATYMQTSMSLESVKIELQKEQEDHMAAISQIQKMQREKMVKTPVESAPMSRAHSSSSINQTAEWVTTSDGEKSPVSSPKPRRNRKNKAKRMPESTPYNSPSDMSDENASALLKDKLNIVAKTAWQTSNDAVMRPPSSGDFPKLEPKESQKFNPKVAAAKEKRETQMHNVLQFGSPKIHKLWLDNVCGCHMCVCKSGNCICKKQYCIWCDEDNHNTSDCKYALKRRCHICDKVPDCKTLTKRDTLCCQKGECCWFCGNAHSSMNCPIRNKVFWSVPKERRLYPSNTRQWEKVVAPPVYTGPEPKNAWGSTPRSVDGPME